MRGTSREIRRVQSGHSCPVPLVLVVTKEILQRFQKKNDDSCRSWEGPNFSEAGKSPKILGGAALPALRSRCSNEKGVLIPSQQTSVFPWPLSRSPLQDS